MGHEDEGAMRSGREDLTGRVLAALWALIVLMSSLWTFGTVRAMLASPGLMLWGQDFRGGAWLSAQRILSGGSPYVGEPVALAYLHHALVTPPLIALVAVPFAHLPFGGAVLIWNGVFLVLFVVGLWLAGLRDTRLYVLALVSEPLVSSIFSAQVDGAFVLLLVIVWRYRRSWVGASALGLLIGMKLFALPLLLWLVATKRFRSAGVTLLSAAAVLIGSWAMVGFDGFAEYPRLLSMASHVAEHAANSMSIAGLLMNLGVGETGARLIAVAVSLTFTAAVVVAARDRDAGWFTATMLLGLLASPILWDHYLLIVFVPLAIWQTSNVSPWLLTSLFWVGRLAHSHDVGVTLVLFSSMAIPLWSVRCPNPISNGGFVSTVDPAPRPVTNPTSVSSPQPIGLG